MPIHENDIRNIWQHVIRKIRTQNKEHENCGGLEVKSQYTVEAILKQRVGEKEVGRGDPGRVVVAERWWWLGLGWRRWWSGHGPLISTFRLLRCMVHLRLNNLVWCTILGPKSYTYHISKSHLHQHLYFLDTSTSTIKIG